ncbi:phage-related minor tail protein [Ruminiclostridium sufflavum DSM 19573]|uniref:Phage-related minor tail protein n=1 Tax=Ruminiclostridium sufflavum DSM 19573 TaxID=1121337 RepID=A0A318XNK8_9FIRM|nr:hypothetical protein [Ruminiclostridium sufflavum]PYG88501.1 phage-related minor tail protein [Ruminiclostridium sufflavum DSM 19573]
MAGNIKGITIEIGGNTEPLNKALQGVNKNSRDLQSELRQVEKLLKLDPTNTALLAQKQELLTKAVQNTADKVNILAKAQKQVEESFNLKKISEEQYRAFQRELISAEAELRKATEAESNFLSSLNRGNKTMQSANSMLDDFKEGYKSLDDSLEETRKGLDKTSNSTKKFNDESENSKNKLGAMTVAFGNLIANGIQAAITKIIELTKSTKEFREDFAKLETNAKVAGVSMEDTNNALRDLNAITGESDSNIEALSNLFQAGFKGNKLQEAVDALSGAVIKFPDTLKIESLADSLQETLATGKSTGQFQEMLGRVGVSVDDFDKGLKRAIKSGTEQEYILDTLAKSGLAKVNEEYRKSNSNLVESANAQYDLNQSLVELSKVIEPIITDLTKALAEILKNGDAVTSLVAAIGAGFVTWQIATTLTDIVKGVKAFQAATEGATVAQALFNGVLVANPIVLIVALIAGLITALIVLWNTNDNFREAITLIWEAIKVMVVTAIDAVVDAFWAVVDFVKNNWQGLLLLLVNPFAGAFKLLYDNCEAFREFINKFVQGIIDFFTVKIPDFVKSIIDWFKDLPEKMIETGENIVKGIWEGIKNTAKWLKDKILGFAGNIVDNIKEALGIQSPSRVLADEVGKYMAQGIGVGFEDEIKSVSVNMNKTLLPKSGNVFGDSSDYSVSGNNGGDTYKIGSVVIDAKNVKELTDVVNMTKNIVQTNRAGRVVIA